MKTPIELAKEHGDYDDIGGGEVIVAFTNNELNAYNRALLAPYVEALKQITDTYKELVHKHYDGTTVLDMILDEAEIAHKTLAAHREMFGGE